MSDIQQLDIFKELFSKGNGLKNQKENIDQEILRDFLIDKLRTSDMNEIIKIIEKFVNPKVLSSVFSFIKKQKNLQTFDLLDNLDYEPSDIYNSSDVLEKLGLIKVK